MSLISQRIRTGKNYIVEAEMSMERDFRYLMLCEKLREIEETLIEVERLVAELED